MTDTADAPMSAHDAAGLLDDLPGYEEDLTARTAGLTWMIWGTAVPGLFMTYNAATPWLETQPGFEWILSILWIPWVLGASLASNALWRTTAVTLDWDTDGREGWLYAVGFTLTFFALAAAIWGLARAAGVALGTNGWMLLSSGLLTVAIGLVYRRQHAPGPTEAIVGGTALVLAGVGLSALALSPQTFAGLLSAGLVGIVYYGMGLRLYRRG